MAVTLLVQEDRLSSQALQDLARELCRTINQETDVRATLVEAPAGPGAKVAGGIPVEQILIPAITEGLGALLGAMIVEVFRSYFERRPHLRIKARGPSGAEVTVDAESIHPDHVQQTVKAIDEILAGKK